MGECLWSMKRLKIDMKCCEGNVRGDRGIKGKGGFIPLLFGQNSPVAKLPSRQASVPEAFVLFLVEILFASNFVQDCFSSTIFSTQL